MNWFPVFVATAVAGVPVLGFKNPAQAVALLLSLGIVVFIWMAMEARKALRRSTDSGQATADSPMFEQASIEVSSDWMDKTAA